MEKRRILLISQPNLLGEGLEHILKSLEDVQVIGSWPPDEQILAHCAEQPVDLVLISDDELIGSQATGLTALLLDTYPNLTIIRVNQNTNFLLVYTSQAIPARVADLIDAIRNIPMAGFNSPSFQP